MIDAIEYCHAHNVIHRDLKPENVLLDSDYRLKITDFGLSAVLSDSNTLMRTQCGSPHYAAPEVLLGKPYDNRVDIWSIGIILYTLVIGRLPFDTDSQTHVYEKVKKGSYLMPEHESVTPEFIDLVKRLIVRDPDHRITIQEIKCHPWLKMHISPVGLGPVLQISESFLTLVHHAPVYRESYRLTVLTNDDAYSGNKKALKAAPTTPEKPSTPPRKKSKSPESVVVQSQTPKEEWKVLKAPSPPMGVIMEAEEEEVVVADDEEGSVLSDDMEEPEFDAGKILHAANMPSPVVPARVAGPTTIKYAPDTELENPFEFARVGGQDSNVSSNLDHPTENPMTANLMPKKKKKRSPSQPEPSPAVDAGSPDWSSNPQSVLRFAQDGDVESVQSKTRAESDPHRLLNMVEQSADQEVVQRRLDEVCERVQQGTPQGGEPEQDVDPLAQSAPERELRALQEYTLRYLHTKSWEEQTSSSKPSDPHEADEPSAFPSSSFVTDQTCTSTMLSRSTYPSGSELDSNPPGDAQVVQPTERREKGPTISVAIPIHGGGRSDASSPKSTDTPLDQLDPVCGSPVRSLVERRRSTQSDSLAVVKERRHSHSTSEMEAATTNDSRGSPTLGELQGLNVSDLTNHRRSHHPSNRLRSLRRQSEAASPIKSSGGTSNELDSESSWSAKSDTKSDAIANIESRRMQFQRRPRAQSMQVDLPTSGVSKARVGTVKQSKGGSSHGSTQGHNIVSATSTRKYSLAASSQSASKAGATPERTKIKRPSIAPGMKTTRAIDVASMGTWSHQTPKDILALLSEALAKCNYAFKPSKDTPYTYKCSSREYKFELQVCQIRSLQGVYKVEIRRRAGEAFGFHTDIVQRLQDELKQSVYHK
eukprot:TRINITY_DN595_c0_g1_i2.p1 TRINITY_DN595_c0_g1~~TRINITY_DN595_c0_g1_i2.p1  ORF type:complete len:875 (+),score=151.30 TRINITY_DN595_c0_g1_i2:673-3297(+)